MGLIPIQPANMMEAAMIGIRREPDRVRARLSG